ncbi:ATP-binding cassette domain-containing protein [Aneurinibacillus aneurinilyticus]|uniref:ABC transporter ATP-binding protein n=1 Tax=Aneurinibacillus aneurinilyticus TaxID=1391 RepID=UPI002E226F8B|nr:ATP-binding cassette domain-containing protein [Aneurinibacillus aneurinilyticus]MED0670117.1 ATP-binding cassette domain-containing protein [Aneurinibacillus aneurinilyticus]
MRFERISMMYNSGRHIFENFSLELKVGRITCIMGASGTGKTTLLRLAAGLEQPIAGHIDRNGSERIGMVFQEPRLLLHKTALENVLWTTEPIATADTARDAQSMLEEAGLGDALHFYPGQLSGGMRQRVALVRAFAFRPTLLLMDEPFQGLDAAARRSMHNLLLNLWRRDRPTVLLATHDCEEATTLGSRIVLLAGTPARIEFELEAVDSACGPKYTISELAKLKQHIDGQIVRHKEETIR